MKFQVPGGQATPAPPVGTALGRFGINLGQFVQQFNERTKEAGGMPIPVVVKVYNDRSFEFVTKSPPAAALLKQAAGIAKGSGVPNKEKVGKVTVAQIDEICKTKMADLNARDVEHARRMVEGTARSMGLEVLRVGKRHNGKEITDNGRERSGRACPAKHVRLAVAHHRDHARHGREVPGTTYRIADGRPGRRVPGSPGKVYHVNDLRPSARLTYLMGAYHDQKKVD